MDLNADFFPSNKVEVKIISKDPLLRPTSPPLCTDLILSNWLLIYQSHLSK